MFMRLKGLKLAVVVFGLVVVAACSGSSGETGKRE